MSVSLHFRTEEATREAIDKLAENTDRDRSWIINQAVKEYLDENAWHVEKILEGRRAIAEGRSYSLDEVRKMVNDRIQQITAKQAKQKKRTKRASKAE